MLVRWKPFNEISVMERNMNEILDRMWGTRRGEYEKYGSFLPPVDIRESKNDYIVELDLPGIEQKDISVGLENDVLTVRGERKFEEEKKEECLTCTERAYGTFVRSFTLPGTVDSEKVAAVYKNGVLTITIPKKEEVKHKSIKVEV